MNWRKAGASTAEAHSIGDIQKALFLELIDADGREESAPPSLTQISTSDIVKLPYAWVISEYKRGTTLTLCWSRLGIYGNLSLALQAPARHEKFSACTLTALGFVPFSQHLLTRGALLCSLQDSKASSKSSQRRIACSTAERIMPESRPNKLTRGKFSSCTLSLKKAKRSFKRFRGF